MADKELVTPYPWSNIIHGNAISEVLVSSVNSLRPHHTMSGSPCASGSLLLLSNHSIKNIELFDKRHGMTE